jgi:hypothetical protein
VLLLRHHLQLQQRQSHHSLLLLHHWLPYCCCWHLQTFVPQLALCCCHVQQKPQELTWQLGMGFEPLLAQTVLRASLRANLVLLRQL